MAVDMPRDLLIEIGVEELPASFLDHALKVMQGAAARLLEEARIEAGAPRALGTPRRMALLVPGVAERQRDREETVIGPPWGVAFKDGKPTKAGEGFAKKQGVDPGAIRKAETEKGAYVAVDVREAGKPTEAVLPELLTELCRRITFPKAMRWGDGDVAFGRPVHWLVGLFGEDVVPFELAGLRAGRTTRGHRFLAPEPFELRGAGEYVDRLAEAHVLADFDARRAKMQDALAAAARTLGGDLVEDDFLLGECLSLVEEPFVVPGRFEPRFLALPEAVIVAVMKNHQRYFAVRKAGTGELLPAYLNVVNTANDPATIARGNDRVLRARLADAEFFVTEDRKARLVDRVPRLSSVVFQARLGTVGEKVQRVVALAQHLAEGRADVSVSEVAEAAQLCKADLETLIVGEFPELQGEMGRFYALEEGLSPTVADAIRDHYRPQGASDALPEGPVGALVSIADKADTLVGCFGVGQKPSGSADPFALRRAALGILRIAVAGEVDVHLTRLLDTAYALYAGAKLAPRDEALASLLDFFRGRLRAFYRERFPGDLVDACLAAWDDGSLRDLDARISAVEGFRRRPEFESLTVAFKRAHNIAKDADAAPYDPALLEDGAERELARCFEALRPRIEASVLERSYADALELIATELRAPIDRYFADVFVMVDDVKVRTNRLRLLRAIAEAVTRIAHFHQLSTSQAAATQAASSS
jgi:glycyl-tRNA synthetase beta chain